MARVPSKSTFPLTLSVVLLVTSLTIVIILLPFLVELEFIFCGPLTRALRSYIPSYDAHITASEKCAEIEEKIENMEAETNAQIKKMETDCKAKIKMEADLMVASWNTKVRFTQQVKEREFRLLAEGGVSEEPMLFSWIDLFLGMAKLWCDAIWFCLGLRKFSPQKKKQVLEVQTAKKET